MNMWCFFCYCRDMKSGPSKTPAILCINGFSVCDFESHILCAMARTPDGTTIEDANEWLDNHEREAQCTSQS